LRSRSRGLLFFALKAAVAAVLITWLVRSGALDFGAALVLVRTPWLVALDLGVFAALMVLGGLRYRALLRLAGVEARLRRTVQLHSVAVFFNVVIPGNVGGDVVKALYVARDADPSKRTTILLLVFVERLLGLGGLVLMATVVTALRGPTLWDDPLLRPLAGTVALLGVAAVVGPIVFVVIMRHAGDRMEAWTGGTTRFGKLMGQLTAALRLVAGGPRHLVAAVLYSMAAHGLAMGMFTVFARVIGELDVGYSVIASLYPLGILTMVLPVSPAGLGVGHMAFEKLFQAAGLSGGATIFNVYLLGQIAPCLLGSIPYLMMKRSGEAPPTAAETGTAAAETTPPAVPAPVPIPAPARDETER
jgi:glycosyltransferase 2 family protein